jgi:hypothetical protein
MRRLRALAALDPEVGAVISARDDRRRIGLRVLAGRLAEDRAATRPIDPENLIRVLYMLTSFETFDALPPRRRPYQRRRRRRQSRRGNSASTHNAASARFSMSGPEMRSIAAASLMV